MSILKARNVAIIGASGALGKALVENLSKDNDTKNIFAFSRKKILFSSEKVQTHSIDFEEEDSIFRASNCISKLMPLDLIIVATGILHDINLYPEKSLKDLSTEKFQKLFLINTIGPALVAKHFFPLLRRDKRAISATLSARVGSVSDNQLGGWYAYRASKAALNIIIKNSAIEISRRNSNSIVVGMHPGTVASNLSKPFQKGVPPGKLFTPELAASRLLNVLSTLRVEDTGKCFAWDGKEILP
ncbi:MAG: SDR family NAD(P)-dependent oxidoreductase [Paracoccaceae bacterium]|nr:SDR family NAD(P)-dependent oxidoreductase [Paracoccaceae bacterium]